VLDAHPSSITIDATHPQGYRRSEGLQSRFDAAKQILLKRDGWPNPGGGDQPELVADLALEGGGVKGIGLVGAVLVLSEVGYRFRAVAGTSAGAVVAALIAAITKSGAEMADLRRYMLSMDFSKFMPEGRVHKFLDHHGGKLGSLADDVAILSRQLGLYSGAYLEEWLSPILEDAGVTTFGDLKLTAEDDPLMSLPDGHNYRLLVHVSDVTRSVLVRLPWDYPMYGYRPDDQPVVQAVRASMSIPLFFEPVTLQAHPVDIKIPRPDGGTLTRHHAGGTVTWVDGGMLRNFPIGAFDRVDGESARWPTIGIKLSSLQTNVPSTDACESAQAVGIRCVRTMLNEWDSYTVELTTAGRTIFVDNGGLAATDFDLTTEQQQMLFLNGVSAGTDFVIEMAEGGGVPRTPDEARKRPRSWKQSLHLREKL
jgi:NTE family protein